jgi:tRNA modification GTPase
MNETIVAISTAIGKAAISIVRMSGDEAISIANSLFKGTDLRKVPSHTVHYGKVVDHQEEVDEVLVTVFRAPKSFTAENVVEIHCHGGAFVTNQVLALCVRNGARLATPGEFTKRAFLNGRIDLTQAESVMDMIEAQTKASLKMANQGLRGDIRDMIVRYRAKIMHSITQIEVNIDYPEYEDEAQITEDVLEPLVNELLEELKSVIERSENSILLKQGIDTVIIGKPNVGKSSLLNALLREEKAIVTDIAGTTRDSVEGLINVGGLILNLIDTAGIRYTEDIVEKIGVEKTKKILSQASLVLLVFDYSSKLDSIDLELLEQTKEKTRIVIVNKVDLEKKIDLDKVGEYLLLSSFNKEDIIRLEQNIKEVTNIQELEDNQARYVTSTRAIAKLKTAHQHMIQAKEAIEKQTPIDMITIDLTQAWKALGEIIGEVSSDELINEMFANFCLGK